MEGGGGWRRKSGMKAEGVSCSTCCTAATGVALSQRCRTSRPDRSLWNVPPYSQQIDKLKLALRTKQDSTQVPSKSSWQFQGCRLRKSCRKLNIFWADPSQIDLHREGDAGPIFLWPKNSICPKDTVYPCWQCEQYCPIQAFAAYRSTRTVGNEINVMQGIKT